MHLNDYSPEFLDSMNETELDEFTNSVNAQFEDDFDDDFDVVCAQLGQYDSPGGQFSS